MGQHWLGWLGKRRVSRAIHQHTGHGPFDGGCLAFALALQQQVGGDIVVAEGGTGACHAAVDLGGVLVDFDGPVSPRQMLTAVAEYLYTQSPSGYAAAAPTRIRPFDPSTDMPRAPRDPAMVQAIANTLPANALALVAKLAPQASPRRPASGPAP